MLEGKLENVGTPTDKQPQSPVLKYQGHDGSSGRLCLPLGVNISHVLHEIIRTIADHITAFNRTWVRTGIKVKLFKMADQ